MADIQTQLCEDNLAVLANAVELGSRVILNIAGNEMSDHLEGQELALPQLSMMLAARLKAALAPVTGG